MTKLKIKKIFTLILIFVEIITVVISSQLLLAQSQAMISKSSQDIYIQNVTFNHFLDKKEAYTIIIPDPNIIEVPEPCYIYTYVFYSDSISGNAHRIEIRAYHVYQFGNYWKTVVEAKWIPALWGYSDERWFNVYVNDILKDSFHETNNINWPSASTKQFYYVFNGGEYLTMVARGKFNGYTGYWDGILDRTCTVPDPYS